jgi:TRAP-type mannitol/chloroaromatic compound transport system substrate-binding protein
MNLKKNTHRAYLVKRSGAVKHIIIFCCKSELEQKCSKENEDLRRNEVKKKIFSFITVLVALMVIASFMTACNGNSGETAAEGSETQSKPKETIKWRLQSYAGPALNEHVVKNAIDEFNKAANGEMVIEVYSADEIVPHGELFRALKEGTVDMAVSDDSSMASPVDVSIFSAYFPLVQRYGLDVNIMWEFWGLNEIWEEAYDEVDGVTWISQGSWDPCNFATTKPIRSIEDFKGLRMYMFPTGGDFMKQFGVIPMSLPYEDVEMAIQTNVLDGVAWSGITEDYTVGWADVNDYYLTNPISGAWSGGWFAHTESWEALPDHLKTMLKMAIDKSHYYRLIWYWWGEAHYRVNGEKLELTTIPDDEWKVIEEAAYEYWEEVAQKSERNARVVEIMKEFVETQKKAGAPYRYGEE